MVRKTLAAFILTVFFQAASAAATRPKITTRSLPGGTAGVSYSATMAGSGGTTPYAWSISKGSLPSGLSIASSTGVISGTPTTVQTIGFTVKLVDAKGNAALVALTLSIGPASPPPPSLSITTSLLSSGIVGTGYSATLQATGGTTPYSWRIFSGALPAGLALGASTGAITGTPTTAGTSSFTVIVVDSSSAPLQSFQTFSLAIVAAPAPTLQITTTGLPDGEVGIVYAASLAASGGTAPYAWTSTALPPGVTLSSGALGGTPTASGTLDVTFTATDSSTPAQTQSVALQLNILGALAITTSSLPNATVSVDYTTQFFALGGTAPYTWLVASGSLPGGLALDANTGILTGAPTGAGSFAFTIQVTDSSGVIALIQFGAVQGGK